MPEIKWTKTYDLTLDDRHFRVAISEHEGGGFHASCLWYEKRRAIKAPGQPGVLQFHLEQRHAGTEIDALSAIQQWAKEKFGTEGDLVLDHS